MLGYWRPHADYQQFVLDQLDQTLRFDPGSLWQYENSISKLWIFDTDMLYEAMLPCYSPTGRPAKSQPEILRVCILMTDLKIPIRYWVPTLKNSFILRTICGLKYSEIPPVGAFYDFIHRIISIDERPLIAGVRRKPKIKLKNGEKLPPKHPGITAKLVEAAKKGRYLSLRPELILQEMFAVVVRQSVKLDLIKKTFSASGDGTCILTGASHYGKRICDCKEKGIYKCDCKRKFSDPHASWGWDSHNKSWFYGYTGYFLSTYNSELKIDLPVYLRLVEAKRHDSISAIIALAEFRQLYPDLTIDTFISDSASDNNATYDLLNYWNINAVIALNEKNTGNSWYKAEIKVNDNGVPVCAAGYEMRYNGICAEKYRSRYKWRCALTAKKTDLHPCAACDSCSKKEYRRVFYTAFDDNDLRLHPAIPRHSAEFILKMNERTAAERVNNTILNTYGIENSKTRGKKRISFFTTMAGINIHLDAQLIVLKARGLFNFGDIFRKALCA